MRGVFLALLMASCTLFETEVDLQKEVVAFMAQDEISALMSIKTLNYSDSELDLDEIDRYNNLTNESDLFDGLDRETIFYPKTLLKSEGSVDLRRLTTPVIESQYGGYCTAYAVMNAYEIITNRRRDANDARYSQRYFFETCYRQYSLQAAVNSAYKCAVPPYACYQSSGKRDCNVNEVEKTKLTHAIAIGNRADLWKYYLDQGYPLAMGAAMSRDWLRCEKAVRGNSPAVRGSGHAVAIVGYNDEGKYFILENSWGKNCGDGGYQYYSYDLLERKDLYHFAYAIIDIDKALSVVCTTDRACVLANYFRRNRNCTVCK